jgi:hypothetical protein
MPRASFEIEENTCVGALLRALRDRFMEKVEVNEAGCWIWQSPPNSKGYGNFSVCDRQLGAHRAAYELFIGPIPEGLQVDHFECDTPSCVNPDHLQAATPKENTLRSVGNLAAINARKTHCKHGHEFDSANTRIRPNGSRACRRCACDSARRKRVAR